MSVFVYSHSGVIFSRGKLEIFGSKWGQTQVRDSVQNSVLPFSKAHKSERKTKFQDQLAMRCQYFLKVHTVKCWYK